MTDRELQSSSASIKNANGPSSRTPVVKPGLNAFARNPTSRDPGSAPASVQGRPFLTSPYISGQKRDASKAADPPPIPTKPHFGLQSDPAALWQVIAQQKKYLDEQLNESNTPDAATEKPRPDAVRAGEEGYIRIHEEPPKTPVEQLDLRTSPTVDATPTHRMALERAREEKLLNLIRSGGSTSPHTRIANIHNASDVPQSGHAAPDLNKPVPPEPASPRKGFLGRLGFSLSNTPVLKAKVNTASDTDPAKSNPKLNTTPLPETMVKTSGSRKRLSYGKRVSRDENAKTSEQVIIKSPSPKMRTEDAKAQPRDLPLRIAESGMTLDPGAARNLERISPAVSVGHSVHGIFEAPMSSASVQTPALSNLADGPPILPDRAPFASTDYSAYSPSVYSGQASWHPQGMYPHTPVSLRPRPLNLQTPYSHASDIQNAAFAPPASGFESGHDIALLRDQYIADEVSRRLTLSLGAVNSSINNLASKTEEQHQAMNAVAVANHAEIMKQLEKISTNQNQTTQALSDLIEYLGCFVTNTSPITIQVPIGRESTTSSSGSSQAQEILPQTTFTPVARRRGNGSKESIEHGPNERAYFRELGMPAARATARSATERLVHPAYRNLRNTH